MVRLAQAARQSPACPDDRVGAARGCCRGGWGGVEEPGTVAQAGGTHGSRAPSSTAASPGHRSTAALPSPLVFVLPWGTSEPAPCLLSHIRSERVLAHSLSCQAVSHDATTRAMVTEPAVNNRPGGTPAHVMFLVLRI